MVTAPLPARIVEKSLASDRMVMDTVVGKYSDHHPLYRQSAMLERDSGRGIQPGDAGRLGDAGGRVADPHGRGDEARGYSAAFTFRLMKLRSTCRCMKAAGRIIKPICGSTAAGRNGGVRLPFGPRTGWTETVSGTVRRSSADGWLCGLRSDRRAENGSRSCWSHAERYFSSVICSTSASRAVSFSRSS